MDKLSPEKLYLFPFIKNLNDYNIVLKYSLQELVKNKAIISNNGFFYSFRWNRELDEFVFDRNTNKVRDINGLRYKDEMPEVCMNDILFSLNMSKDALKKINLLNEEKLLVFEINNTEYNFVGIFKRNFRGKKTKELLGINKFLIYDLDLKLNDVLTEKLSISSYSKRVEVFKQSHRKLYELICNSTLIFNEEKLNVKEVLFKNKSVNCFEDVYFYIVKQIENNILDIIGQEKIIYRHRDTLISISKNKTNKDLTINKKEVELLPPLGIFTL